MTVILCAWAVVSTWDFAAFLTSTHNFDEWNRDLAREGVPPAPRWLWWLVGLPVAAWMSLLGPLMRIRVAVTYLRLCWFRWRVRRLLARAVRGEVREVTVIRGPGGLVCRAVPHE